jgi:four helix bundle protein
MRDFKELRVWQNAHQLAREVYRITQTFPRTEEYGLVSQLRRSVTSIPANIAEGCGRNGDRDFSRFLTIAAGSATETEYHVLLAHDLKYVQTEDYVELNRQINDIKRMLNVFVQRLATKV